RISPAEYVPSQVGMRFAFAAYDLLSTKFLLDEEPTMPRCLMTVGMAMWIVALLGADFKATQLQREMSELLDLTLGLDLLPKSELGAEYSFEVTDQAIKALKNLKETGTPIQIANSDPLAA